MVGSVLGFILFYFFFSFLCLLVCLFLLPRPLMPAELNARPFFVCLFLFFKWPQSISLRKWHLLHIASETREWASHLGYWRSRQMALRWHSVSLALHAWSCHVVLSFSTIDVGRCDGTAFWDLLLERFVLWPLLSLEWASPLTTPWCTLNHSQPLFTCSSFHVSDFLLSHVILPTYAFCLIAPVHLADINWDISSSWKPLVALSPKARSMTQDFIPRVASICCTVHRNDSVWGSHETWRPCDPLSGT